MFLARFVHALAPAAAVVLLIACTGRITEQGSAPPAALGPGGGMSGAAGGAQTLGVCDPLARGRADANMRRLSQREYARSLSDIFGETLLQGVPALGQFPNDVIVDSVDEFQPLHALEHVDAINEVALQLSHSLVTQRAMLERVAPACLGAQLDTGALQDDCVRSFVASLGLKLLRRPLGAAELDTYVGNLNPADPELLALSEAERLELVVGRLLQAPDLLFHRASAGEVVADRARVDAFSVASRLSYRLTESAPDAELLGLAQSGQLLEPAVLRAQARRLLDSPSGHERVRGLFSHWLRMGRLLPVHPAPLGRAGLASDDAAREQLRQEMVHETLDFAEHVVFTPGLNFASLFDSPLAFPASDAMAKVLDLPPGARGPVEVQNPRRGLLMRPAVLASARERDAPILRGITIRVRVLCDELPPPPANSADIAEAVQAELDPTQLSTRELATQVTAGTQCMACHARLNPLGFALGHFGPLGEWRDSERIYAASGELVHELPIDTRVENADVAAAADAIQDQATLTELVHAAPKSKTCLARYAFRFTRLRLETPDDACQLDDIQSRLASDASLTDALVEAVAADDIFYKGITP